MAGKKTVFIIPGFRHLSTSKAYKEISKFLKKDGFHPIVVPLSWKNTDFEQNTEIFLKKYKKLNRKKKYILGFSFGAIVAFLASTKTDVSGLILCSLSPYFKEDTKYSSLMFSDLIKQIKAEQIFMIYGTKEARSLISRVRKTYSDSSLENKYLYSIKNIDHTISHKKYLQTIYQTTKLLN